MSDIKVGSKIKIVVIPFNNVETTIVEIEDNYCEFTKYWVILNDNKLALSIDDFEIIA